MSTETSNPGLTEPNTVMCGERKRTLVVMIDGTSKPYTKKVSARILAIETPWALDTPFRTPMFYDYSGFWQKTIKGNSGAIIRLGLEHL